MALSSLWARTTGTDRGLIALLVLTILGSLFFTFGRVPGKQLVIYAGEKIVFSGPLAQDRRLDLQGPLGVTSIEVAGGRVRVVSSPCPRKICIGMGEAWRSGDLLACVPNRIVVRIEGEGSKGYDLLSR
jgi:hypothetical protein